MCPHRCRIAAQRVAHHIDGDVIDKVPPGSLDDHACEERQLWQGMKLSPATSQPQGEVLGLAFGFCPQRGDQTSVLGCCLDGESRH